MIKINIHSAKTHLSKYLSNLKEGETIIICKRNRPVAELRLIPGGTGKKRPIGLAGKVFKVPGTFFESLPEEILDSFSGGGK